MKRVNILGQYSNKPKACSPKDLHIFHKMAGKFPEGKVSPVMVMYFTPGQKIVFCKKIVRWKIVETPDGGYLLAYRTSMNMLKYPLIYQFKYSCQELRTDLHNVTRQFSKFERLKMYFEANSSRS